MEPSVELRGYRSDRLGAVDHEPTIRVCRCQRQKRFPNPFVEAVALLFESIGWPIDPGEADTDGDIKKHVHIGPRVTDRELGQAEYGFDAERPTSALVRQRLGQRRVLGESFGRHVGLGRPPSAAPRLDRTGQQCLGLTTVHE